MNKWDHGDTKDQKTKHQVERASVIRKKGRGLCKGL
jgi:hypothetical protein